MALIPPVPVELVDEVVSTDSDAQFLLFQILADFAVKNTLSPFKMSSIIGNVHQFICFSVNISDPTATHRLQLSGQIFSRALILITFVPVFMTDVLSQVDSGFLC